tara:strand:+ start:393 stop:4385 length:3993 start_codon:yes stop_codon:yes gene_type:complete
MSKSKKKSKKLEPIIEDSSLESENIEMSDNEETFETEYEIEIEETDDETSSEPSSSSFSSELRLVENIILKGEKYSIFQKAVSTNTPEKFIFKIDGDFLSAKIKISNSMNIVDNYDFFYTRGIKINPADFIMLFYIANKNKDKQYLIDNFNMFKDISNKKEPYFVEAFDDYAKKFNNYYKFLIDKTKEEYKKFEDFYSKVDKLKSSQDINRVTESFVENSTEVEISIRDENYMFDVENAKIIFNNFQMTDKFPFARLNLNGEILYKVYTQANNVETYVEENEAMEFIDNTIYIFYSITINNKLYTNKLMINLETSKMTLEYPSDGLGIIKENIVKFYPTIEFLASDEKNMTGEFEITFKNFDETKLYYLTLFDKTFSEFLFVRELSSPRSLKEKLKFYYVGTEDVRKYVNYSVYFNMEKLQGDKYIVNFTSKKHSPRLIKEFMVVLSKLIGYYQNIPEETMLYYNIITKPYTGIDGDGLGGKEEDRMIAEKQKSKKKIDSLVIKNKKLFSKNFYARSCTCQKQPIVVPEEDVEDWKNYTLDGKKRNVVLFPPENSTHRVAKHHYTCPDDEYQTLTLRQNPDPSSEFPLIPCCNISNFPEDLYRDYDEIRKNSNRYWLLREEYRGKGKGILKTTKVLSTDRLGYLPDFVENLLRELDNRKFIREGVAKNSKSSLLHIMMKIYPDIEKLVTIDNQKQNKVFRDIMKNYEKYSQFNNVSDKNKYIFKLRYGIVKEILIPQISSQETYQFTEDEVIEMFGSYSKTLESEYFYKSLELIFCANIFVFVYDKDKDKTYLEIPNHNKYHIREVREELPCILILKHIRRNTFNVYEAIRAEKEMEETKSNYVFSTKFTKYLKNYILNKSYYTINSRKKDVTTKGKKESEISVRKNPFSYINWNKILKDYVITSQMINSNGRCFAFNLEYKKGKEMTLFIEPTFPFNVKESYLTEKASIKEIIKFFGDNYTKGEDGLWYPLNDEIYGFFVPCSDKCTGTRKCKNYILLSCKNNIDRTYENIKIAKKNSFIFLQTIKWLFLLEDIPYQEWKEKYMIKDDKLSENIMTESYSRVPYRFPQKAKTTQEGIGYLNEYHPGVFNNNKIYLYPKLYENLDRHMLNYLKKYEGLELINKKVISNIFIHLEDYNVKKFTKIIIGKEKYRIWKSKSLQEDTNRNTIYEEEDICKEFPFVWKNNTNGAVYFVQNNKENSKICSIINSLFWSITGNNKGYDMKLTTIWSELMKVKDNMIEKYFGWNMESLKEYIKEKTLKDVYFLTTKEYLNFLIQNRVPYQINKEYSYIVYSKVGEKISVTEKYIIDNRPPLELYRYSDGGFASLLDLI